VALILDDHLLLGVLVGRLTWGGRRGDGERRRAAAVERARVVADEDLGP